MSLLLLLYVMVAISPSIGPQSCVRYTRAYSFCCFRCTVDTLLMFIFLSFSISSFVYYFYWSWSVKLIRRRHHIGYFSGCRLRFIFHPFLLLPFLLPSQFLTVFLPFCLLLCMFAMKMIVSLYTCFDLGHKMVCVNNAAV